MVMNCVYCLESGEFREEQILLRGEHLYLCAPRGQLVEGYLAIAPYRCIGSLSRMPVAWFADLARLTAVVADFYAKAYGATRMTLYEQGRAGGGASVDDAGGFPLHAHLCCLPVSVDLHGVLASAYATKCVSGMHEIPAVVSDEPYLYVESADAKSIYVARSAAERVELERQRLKPTIAALMGIPERGHWRAYPGDVELGQLIERWRNVWTGLDRGVR